MSADCERNLLVGMTAYQLGLITESQLAESLLHWTKGRKSHLEQLLHQASAIDQPTADFLGRFAEQKVSHSALDSQWSLSRADTNWNSVREQLLAINDAELGGLVEAMIPAEPGKEGKAGTVRDHDETILGPQTLDGSSSGSEPGQVGDLSPLDTLAHSGSEVRISRYQVLRPHAKGGLGEVSVAMDGELNRQVALKQIRSRFADDGNARQRFVLEAEVTGGLEHPGVVPVYGLGSYADGRPYYAMRLIHGRSLKKAADELHAMQDSKTASKHFELRRLLDRFVDVCQTIEYAHSRGVWHRDLKPDNIMLGDYGETLVVDWGLAKAAGQDAAAQDIGVMPPLEPASGSGSAPTQLGSVIGTPAYMSPEQAAGRVDQISSVSDVYSLGATLYYILVGKPAFRTVGDDVDIGKVLEQVMTGNFSRPREIKPEIEKALEAICLKAMATKVEDRYQSPRALAEDLECYLADEPIVAMADTWQTQLRRWFRRNQTLATSLLGVLVVVAIGITLFSLVLGAKQAELSKKNEELLIAEGAARQAAEDAEREKEAAEKARDEAELASNEANVAREHTYAFSEFLLNHILSSARPEGVQGGLGSDVTVIDAIEHAEGMIDEIFDEIPMAEVTVRSGIGGTWYNLGEYQRAEQQQEAVVALFEDLDKGGVEYLHSLGVLASTKRELGDLASAVELGERCAAGMEDLLGTTDRTTIIAKNNLAITLQRAGRWPEAIERFEELLVETEAAVGRDHPEVLNAMHNLAEALRFGNENQRQRALGLFHQVVAKKTEVLGAADPETLVSVNGLATMLEEGQQYEQAVALLESAVKAMSGRLGKDHPDVLTMRSNLGKAYWSAGQNAVALTTLEEAWVASQNKLGENHPSTLNALDLYANYLSETTALPRAIDLFSKVLAGREAVLGESNVDTLTTMNNFALALAMGGQPDRAIELFERSLARRRQIAAANSTMVLEATQNLAMAYWNHGRREDALKLMQEKLQVLQDSETHSDNDIWQASEELALLEAEAGKTSQALQRMSATLEQMEATSEVDEDTKASMLYSLGVMYLQAEDFDAARLKLLDAVSQQEAKEQIQSDDARRMQIRGMLVYLSQAEIGAKRYDDAVEHAGRSVELAQELIPGDWRVANAQSVLAEALGGAGKIDEALELMKVAHEELVDKLEPMPPAIKQQYLGASFARIIALLEKSGDEDALNLWRQQKSQALDATEVP